MNPLVELFKIYSENNAKNQHYVRSIIFILSDMGMEVFPEDGYACLYHLCVFNLHIECKDAGEDYIKIKDYYGV